MKKQRYTAISRSFFLILFLLIPFFALADETLTITTYYPSPYGSYKELYVADKLGIGTTEPQDALHVAGNIRVQRYNTVNLISDPTPGSTRGLRFYPDMGISNALVGFQGWNFSSGAETPINVAFLGGGNVGIGKTNPNLGQLNISGVGAAPGGEPRRIITVESTNPENDTWRWMDFIRNGVDSEFIVYGSGNVRADGSFNSPADYAEYFYSEDITLKPGELVCIAGNDRIKRCNKSELAIGIISTKPGVVGIYAEDVTDAAEKYEKDPHWVKVGLLGQVPVKVSVANGVIKAGDTLSAGDNGAAIKGNSPRTLLMLALEGAIENKTIKVLIK